MNEYTVAVGIVSCGLALLGFPFMFMRSERAMLGGLLLAVPFTAFMAVLTFVVGVR